MNAFATLLKREYWENRGNFAIAPAAIGAFFIIIFIFALFNTEHFSLTHGLNSGTETVFNGSFSGKGEVSGVSLLSSLTNDFANLPLERRERIWEIALIGIGLTFISILVLVSFIYLLGSLYDDRKDRSIMFWKSLPVSDLMTVNSKIATLLFVMPAFFLAATILTYLGLMLIISMVAIFTGGELWEAVWQPAPFLLTPIKLYLSYLIKTLWAAPFLAWLLLVSSWTKHKPILLATLPLFAITFLEFYYYRTNVFATAVKERILGWVVPVDIPHFGHSNNQGLDLESGVNFYNGQSFLSLSSFWYGLIVAAIMVAAAVYIRRYRDDS